MLVKKGVCPLKLFDKTRPTDRQVIIAYVAGIALFFTIMFAMASWHGVAWYPESAQRTDEVRHDWFHERMYDPGYSHNKNTYVESVVYSVGMILAGLLLAGIGFWIAVNGVGFSTGGFAFHAGLIFWGLVVVLIGIVVFVHMVYVAVGSGAGGSVGGNVSKKITIGMMPRSKGNEYFIDCKRGADEAAAELGINLLWDGPTEPDPVKQFQVVDTWIARGVDVIAVSVEDRQSLASVLRKARTAGIKVITWEADTEPDARDFFVNQATPEGIGQALMDNAAAAMGNKGEYAMIMGTRTATNMIEWKTYIDARMAEKYPDIKCIAVEACNNDPILALSQADALIKANPNVKLIMAISSPAVPAAAEAIKQAGKDVKVVGLGTPNANKPYVHAGTTDAVILWSTKDLGYLTVYAAKALAEGKLKAGDANFEAGRLKKLEVKGDHVLLGTPFRFDKTNIDQFDF